MRKLHRVTKVGNNFTISFGTISKENKQFLLKKKLVILICKTLCTGIVQTRLLNVQTSHVLTDCSWVLAASGNKADLIAVAQRLEAEGGIFQPWRHYSWGPA
jgi:hypothetical protein